MSDIATVEKLTLFCHWVENGSPIEYFMGILPFKKGNAEPIYSTLIDWLKKKKVRCRKLVGWALMVQQHLWERNLQFKYNPRRTHHMLSSSTVIVIDFSWQLFKIQIVLRGSSMSTLHSTLCGKLLPKDI